MRKFSSLLMLGCAALILLTAVPAEAGLFGGYGSGLFGRRAARQQAFSAGSCGSSAQSFQSYQSFQSFQSGQVTPAFRPIYQAPRPSFQAPTSPCPGGFCPTSQANPLPPAYDYLNELNALRSRHGLSPVGFDQQMYNDAMTNNQEQRRQGLGHFFMGMARRQNSAMGQASAIQAMRIWEASGPHLAALLDPGISAVAVAGDGPAWTFCAR